MNTWTRRGWEDNTCIKVYCLNKRAGCGLSMGAEGQYPVRIAGELP